MNRSILIVDNAEFMRFVLRNLMIENGISLIAEAGNHEEAMGFLQALQPELVTIDLTTPTVGGLTLVRAVRDAAPQTRIIAVKGLGELSLKRKALSAGADAVVVKPYDPAEIRAVLADIWASDAIHA